MLGNWRRVRVRVRVRVRFDMFGSKLAILFICNFHKRYLICVWVEKDEG